MIDEGKFLTRKKKQGNFPLYFIMVPMNMHNVCSCAMFFFVETCSILCISKSENNVYNAIIKLRFPLIKIILARFKKINYRLHYVF